MANRHKMFRRGGRAHGGAATHDVYSGAASNVAKEARNKGDAFKRGGHHHVGKVHGGSAKHRLDKRARGGGVGGGGHSPFSHAAKMQDKHRTPATKDHAQPRKHGGRTHGKHPFNFGHHHGVGHEEPHEKHPPIHHKHGGEVMKAVGAGHRRKRKHGGRTHHDGDDDEDDEAGYAKGGRYAAADPHRDDEDDDESETLKGIKEGTAAALSDSAEEFGKEAIKHAPKVLAGLAGIKRGGRAHRAHGGRAPHIDIYNTKGGSHHWIDIDKSKKGGRKG